jgi:hypothetical protein
MEDSAMSSSRKLKVALLGLVFAVVVFAIPSTFSNEPQPVALEEAAAELALLNQGDFVVDEPQVIQSAPSPVWAQTTGPGVAPPV